MYNIETKIKMRLKEITIFRVFIVIFTFDLICLLFYFSIN